MIPTRTTSWSASVFCVTRDQSGSIGDFGFARVRSKNVRELPMKWSRLIEVQHGMLTTVTRTTRHPSEYSIYWKSVMTMQFLVT